MLIDYTHLTTESPVFANFTLHHQNLLNQKTTLVCSEKKSALDVIVKRLTDLGLNSFVNQIQPEKMETKKNAPAPVVMPAASGV